MDSQAFAPHRTGRFGSMWGMLRIWKEARTAPGGQLHSRLSSVDCQSSKIIGPPHTHVVCRAGLGRWIVRQSVVALILFFFVLATELFGSGAVYRIGLHLVVVPDVEHDHDDRQDAEH